MDIVTIIKKLAPSKIGIVAIDGKATLYLEKRKVIYRLISTITYSETEYYEVSITQKGILMEMLSGEELVIIDGVLQNKELRYVREDQPAQLPVIGSFSREEYFTQMNDFDELEASNFLMLNESLFQQFDLAKHLGINTINIAKFDDFVRVYALDKLYAGVREFDTGKIQAYGELRISISLNKGLFDIIRDNVLEYNPEKSNTDFRQISAYEITEGSTLLEGLKGAFYALIPGQVKRVESDFIIQRMVEKVNESDLYEFEFDQKTLSYFQTTDRRIKFQSADDTENGIAVYMGASGSYMKTDIKTDAPPGVQFEAQVKKLQMMFPNGWNYMAVGNQCVTSTPKNCQFGSEIAGREYIITSA